MKYAFVLGRESALSVAEILALIKAKSIEYDNKTALFARDVLIIDTDKEITTEFFHELGGSIKFAEILKETHSLEKDLTQTLRGLEKESIDFGLSYYGGKFNKVLAMEIKKTLKAEGMSVRVVPPKKDTALTSVQVDKNKLIEKGAELLIIDALGKTYIARTLAVQDFEEFGRRDFGRPGRDARSGMLPPKLARMMINLAATSKDELILDPFCGSGTIMTEAVLLGYQQLLATDVSEKAVADTMKNYNWTIEKAHIRGVRFKTFKKDVKSLHEKVERESVSAIVSEPFLGPPLRGHESDQQIHRNFLELMDLYRGAFKSFAKMLKPGGVVVFIFPFFGHKHVSILSELREQGFKPEGLLPSKAVEAYRAKSSTGLIYKRHDQRVGRDIFRFRFEPKATLE